MYNLYKAVAFGFILIMISSLIACQTPAGRTAGEVVDDATITTRVKAALFNDEIVSGFAISVDTFEGQVTLTGAVDNARQRVRAGNIAGSVNGVSKVNNLLNIKEN